MSLLSLLQSRSKSECERLKAPALAELAKIFPGTEWGIDTEFNYYTSANVSNLWNNELRKGVKYKLENAGVDESDYGDWLGDVHFINISIYRKNLFDKYRSNAGWRIAIIGIPRAESIIVGLASHYQNAQNHNKLGEVSNLIYDVALDAASNDNLPLPGRKISSADWDQAGLIVPSIHQFANVEISPDFMFLKDIRTTTLKKILASFISITPLQSSLTNAELERVLNETGSLARYLAENVYPFGALEDFEAFRSLAYLDLAAAGTRIQLRKKSSTRSIVRVYYGPPGTGKTLSAVSAAVKLIDPTFDANLAPSISFEKFNALTEQCAFVTFHPSLQYEDLVESIRPLMGEPVTIEELNSDIDTLSNTQSQKGGELAYKVHEGILLRMIRRALRNLGKEFVLVIDEINRGDVSRILGPLITALEADKRLGAEFPIGIELQYPLAGELESRLFMPSNLHIIGTMNSSDRNIALVDHALRRRFDFILVPPEPKLLERTTDSDSIDCAKLLATINSRIEHLIDADHCIGHGYLIGCDSNSKVIERLATKIIPLLREYFYGNEALILLVLGESPSSKFNMFELIKQDTQYSKIFNVNPNIAAAYGYRPHTTPRSLKLDSRFWSAELAIPGPSDEYYATQCVLKIYQEIAAQNGIINTNEAEPYETTYSV
ncbi:MULTISPECIES: McrB family protein [unclassified Pseudomonas]|uniref:McrB family protein n=1 Tax=unclassified Pseudomonas TaxID=196821 RepID=UPI0004B41932|nr:MULTISPECIES: AAA family ATPase [unclassified Pseudomonas]